ncbi:MAG: amidohydrolase family protein, partial [Acetobacteraceae bacterium]|nr:amidohydrolase family protein [Acetobacteraceae bacterium]
KLSNYGAYTPDGTLAAHRDTLRTCIDAFGPDRSMFGSDYPVARRNMTYPTLLRRFREIAAEYSADEQDALFHRTASRLYGLQS